MTTISESYSILSVFELKEILKNEQKKNNVLDYDKQLSTNQAFVYYLHSGKVILLPNNLLDSSKGVLFDTKASFEYFLERDSFPIENERATLEEKHQTEILNLNNRIAEIIDRISLKLGSKQSSESLSGLLHEMKKPGNRKVLKEEIFNCGLILGEYVRRQKKGKWILLKLYGTFNPYYTPAILYPDKSVMVLRNSLSHYFDNNAMTPEKFIQLPFINEPVLNYDGNTFKGSYTVTKILE